MSPNRTRSAFPMWLTLIALLAGAALALTLAATGQAVEGNNASGDMTVTRSDEEPYGDPGPQNLHLNGTVVDEDGQGLGGVELLVENHWVNRSDEEDDERGHYRQTVATDENGFYSLNVSEGHIEIRIDEDGYQQLNAGFEIHEDRTVELPMRAEDEDAARLEVTVRVDGEIEDARVSVRPAEDETRGASESRSVRKTGDGIRLHYRSTVQDHAYERTDGDGTVTVELKPGTYEVQARADDHVPDRATVELAANETTAVELSPVPVPADSLEVGGIVRDADSGEPVPGARVQVVNDRWGERAYAYADTEGRWSVSLPPGPVLVMGEADRGDVVPCEGAPEDAEPAHGDRCRVDRTPGYLERVAMANGSAGERVEVDLDLPRAPAYDATISGWVINETSEEGVPNATVTVRNALTGDWGRAEADADGSFSIDVQAGYYTVRAAHPDHPAGVENVRVDAGEEERIALEVPPGPAYQDRRYHAMPGPVYAEHGDSGAVADGDAASGTAERETGVEDDEPGGEPAYEGAGGGLGAYTSDSESSAEALGVGVLATLAVGVLSATAWTRRVR